MKDDKCLGRIAAVGYDYAAQPKEHVRVCNLCGSEHHIGIAHADRYGFPACLAVCVDCGLGFLSPRMTAGAYVQFYERVHRRLQSAYWGRAIDEETIQQKQCMHAGFVWRLLEPQGATIGTLLDIGGSTGVISRELLRFMGANSSARVTVLDPAPREVAVARGFGFEVVEGLLEEFVPGARRWDAVLLCQTVDHLLDIRGGLGKIRKLVTDDGFFFFDVVDWAYMRERLKVVSETVKIDHLFYLERETALAFAEAAGFRVVAEAASFDGHLVGFLCAPGSEKPLDRVALKKHAEKTIRDIRRLQARYPEEKLYWAEEG